MRIKNALPGMLFIALMVTGCTSGNTHGSGAINAVAEVNGAVLTEDDLFLQLGEGLDSRENPAARARALEDLVNTELLYQNGIALGLDRDAKYRDMVTVMEMRLRELKRAEITRRVMNTRIASTVNVSYEDARRYYEQNKQNISTDLYLRVLRFADEPIADEANRRLQAGTPFMQAAGAAETGRPGRMASWDAGFLHWNQIPMEWEKTLYTLDKGCISGVLRSKKAGICIVQIADRKVNPDAGFEKMSASIMNRLRDLRVQEAYDRYIRELRRNARIVQFGKGGKPLEK